LCEFSQLRTLDMAIQVNDSALICLSRHLPRLTKLNLSQCSKLSNETVNSFASSCADLHDIRLGSCGKISSLSFTSLLRTSNPVHLWLGGVTKLTDSAVECLVQMSPPLLSLSLVGCSRLTNNALSCLSMTRPGPRPPLAKGLTELNVGGTQISSLDSLIRGDAPLGLISAGECKGVTARGASEDEDVGPLQVLDLWNCHRLQAGFLCELLCPKRLLASPEYAPRLSGPGLVTLNLRGEAIRHPTTHSSSHTTHTLIIHNTHTQYTFFCVHSFASSPSSR
jgi:Leucine-rich repeat (LRR) protein